MASTLCSWHSANWERFVLRGLTSQSLATHSYPLLLQVAHGIEPGMHLSLKTSNEMVYTTLSFAALHSLLNAHADWEVSYPRCSA